MTNNISVNIFGREYSIKCHAHEIDALYKSVELLNEEMNKTASANHILNTDQVAVLTALNLAHQLLSVKHTTEAHDALKDRLKHLLNRLNNSLANISEVAV